MNKLELIKRLVEAETETLPLGFEEDPMGFILKKYPGLNNVMEYMMTKEFREFVDAIFVVAPKPTTFKVLLHNGQYFFLQFMGDTYQATVLGKNYYLKSIGEKERCMLAIARLLRYGTPLKTKGPEGGETGTEGGAEAGGLGGETTPTDTGGEEAGGEEAGGEALEESKILELLLKESIMEAPKKKKDEEENYSENIQKLLNRIAALGEYSPEVTGSGSSYRITFKRNVASTGKPSRSLRWKLAKLIASRAGASYRVPKDKTGNDTPNIIIKKGGNQIKIELKGYTEGASNTDQKEGLAVLFYYIPELKDPITKENYKESIDAALDFISKSGGEIYGLEKLDDVKNYLKGIKNTPETKYIKTLNQSLSQAVAIRDKYPGARVTMDDRTTNPYGQLRKLAHDVLGGDKDKWCPADLFVVLNSPSKKDEVQFDSIESIIQDLEAYRSDQNFNELTFIQKLNSAFTSRPFGSMDAPLTAVSLKYEKAQLGKAKSYMKDNYGDLATEYNVTKDDLKKKEPQIEKEIKIMRDNIQKKIKQRSEKNPTITYELDDSKISTDQLRGKFAGLKVINFWFNQINNPNKIDNAVVELVQFALSLTTINPTFFKVKGFESGEPGAVSPFGAGVTLTLARNAKINIVDSPTYKGLKIIVPIVKTAGEEVEKMSIQISAKSNGNTQGTIELENA